MENSTTFNVDIICPQKWLLKICSVVQAKTQMEYRRHP
jgi:hypothetical protein